MCIDVDPANDGENKAAKTAVPKAPAGSVSKTAPSSILAPPTKTTGKIVGDSVAVRETRKTRGSNHRH
jgi:hypothetical protein